MDLLDISQGFTALKDTVRVRSILRWTYLLSSWSVGLTRPDGSVEPSIVAPTTYNGGEPEIFIAADDEYFEYRTTLSSVASRAKRFSIALDRFLAEHPELTFPRVIIRFGKPDETLSALQLPHRASDQYLRSTNKAKYFAEIFAMRVGQTSFDDNSTLGLTRMPLGLVLGGWAGNLNQLGESARAYCAQIIGITRLRQSAVQALGNPIKNAISYYVHAMRRDPLITGSATLYEHPDSKNSAQKWTIDPTNISAATIKEAETFKTKTKKAKAETKNPFSLATYGLGDILARSTKLRGVLIDYAIETATLDLRRLADLQFPIDGKNDAERNLSARTYLAALALLGHELLQEHGHFIRSGCSLVVTDHYRDIIAPSSSTPKSKANSGSADGADRSFFSWEDRKISRVESAMALYNAAVADLEAHGLKLAEPVTAEASKDLIKLLSTNGKSVERAEGDVVGDEGDPA